MSTLAIIGGVAAALAIYQGAVAAISWYQGSRVRKNLKNEFLVALHMNQMLSETVVELRKAFVSGVGWSGRASWPPSIAKHMDGLRTIEYSYSHSQARVRGLAAVGPLERLRENVEELIACLRRAAAKYRKAATDTYQSTMGEPLLPSATGEGPVLMFGSDFEDFVEFREELMMKTESVAYDLGMAESDEYDPERWPLYEWEMPLVSEAAEAPRVAPPNEPDDRQEGSSPPPP